QDIVLGDAMQMRAHKLPGSVIWIDAPWMTAFDDFNFNPTQFPDVKGMIAQLHAQGYEVMVWSAPFVNNADDTKTECGILPPAARRWPLHRDGAEGLLRERGQRAAGAVPLARLDGRAHRLHQPRRVRLLEDAGQAHDRSRGHRLQDGLGRIRRRGARQLAPRF